MNSGVNSVHSILRSRSKHSAYIIQVIMKLKNKSIVMLSVLAGLLWVAVSGPMQERNLHFERIAMASIGYQIVNYTHPYPSDRYAMPEPYSSKALVAYSYKGVPREIKDTLQNFASTE